MADAVNPSWESEHIPDEDQVYMRAHRRWFEQGQLDPGVFRDVRSKAEKRTDPEERMSTDWSKYASAEETRLRGKVPADNAIIALNVGEVRQVPEQRVQHSPDLLRNNRAHTDVYGPKSKHPEVRLKLFRIATVEIPLDDLP